MQRSSNKHLGLGGIVLSGLFLLLAQGCSTAEEEMPGEGELGEQSEEGELRANWKGFPDGQCYTAVRAFYGERFGATVPSPREGGTSTCEYPGACLLWVQDLPSDREWERISPKDGQQPGTYDMMIYEHKGSTTGRWYGHVAVVDHVSNGKVFVMDSNWVSSERRASVPHTVNAKVLGWYHLKNSTRSSTAEAEKPESEKPAAKAAEKPAEKPAPKPAEKPESPAPKPAEKPSSSSNTCKPGGYYCGGDKLKGDSDTLYRCGSNHEAVKVRECDDGCEVNSGTDDSCKKPSSSTKGKCVTGGYYCGGDKLKGDPDVLYRCQSDGTGDKVRTCKNGCSVNSGRDDSCK